MINNAYNNCKHFVTANKNIHRSFSIIEEKYFVFKILGQLNEST